MKEDSRSTGVCCRLSTRSGGTLSAERGLVASPIDVPRGRCSTDQTLFSPFPPPVPVAPQSHVATKLTFIPEDSSELNSGPRLGAIGDNSCFSRPNRTRTCNIRVLL